MTTEHPACPQCNRKIMQSISNRCMYCGADLPKEHHLSQEQKNQLLTEKLEQFRRNEENAEELNSGMRRNFGLPEKKARKTGRKQKKTDSSQAVTDALADIQEQIEQIRQQKNSDN